MITSPFAASSAASVTLSSCASRRPAGTFQQRCTASRSPSFSDPVSGGPTGSEVASEAVGSVGGVTVGSVGGVGGVASRGSSRRCCLHRGEHRLGLLAPARRGALARPRPARGLERQRRRRRRLGGGLGRRLGRRGRRLLGRARPTASGLGAGAGTGSSAGRSASGGGGVGFGSIRCTGRALRRHRRGRRVERHDPRGDPLRLGRRRLQRRHRLLRRLGLGRLRLGLGAARLGRSGRGAGGAAGASGARGTSAGAADCAAANSASLTKLTSVTRIASRSRGPNQGSPTTREQDQRPVPGGRDFRAGPHRVGP